MPEHDAQPYAELASFGEELRREREIRGISLKEIADATKISKRFLEAIEQLKRVSDAVAKKGVARFEGVRPPCVGQTFFKPPQAPQRNRAQKERHGMEWP